MIRAIVLVTICLTVALSMLGGCAHSLNTLDRQQLKCNEACVEAAGSAGHPARYAVVQDDKTCKCKMDDDSIIVVIY
jgi:hypothetical protein